jgi:hypothetical protein
MSTVPPTVEQYIQRIVAEAPPLSNEQRDNLVAILCNAPETTSRVAPADADGLSALRYVRRGNR